MMPSRPIVIVMVKAPAAGRVKTRLTPALSGDDAASLAEAFAQDVVAAARQSGAAVMIAYTPDDGRPLLEAMLGDGLHWAPQQGRSLGERMAQAMADAQTLSFSPLLVVGTDSPTLPGDILTQAVNALGAGETDIVLGPTEDGGYYLAGAQQPVPGLFDDVAWSTPLAFAHTAGNVARLNLRCLILPPWYDIDTPDDLARLRREIAAEDALRLRVPATAAWLQSHPFVSLPPGDAHQQTTD